MSEKRRGLGKGLGALIPTAPAHGRPVDVFFPDSRSTAPAVETDDALAPVRPRGTAAERAASASPAPTASSAAAPAAAKPKTGGSRGRKSVPPIKPRASAASAASVASAPEASSSSTTAARSAASPEEPAEPTTPNAAVTEQPGEDGLVPVPGATFAQLPVTDVVANRRQPRQVFDEEDLEELAASIREVGVLQPIVVRPLAGGDAPYELIMGERRWRAAQLAGSDTIPAIIREVADTDLLRDALLENLHRAQLNPLEEAAAYQQLLDDFECTHEELAARIARSRPQISNTLRLLKLPPLVQRRVAAGILSAGHARALLGLSDPGAMERLAQRIVAEGLSVRTTEEIVALGDEPVAPEMRRRPRSGAHAAELEQLATRLADRFDTRVKIGMGQRKGRINIEFASLEDLNRILEVLAPSVERLPVD